ncbi:MAG: O-antigen ligase family protein [Vicingaceae bacterium]|nr:O-antigen ligase family protein [Vicingaceae bacterium]
MNFDTVKYKANYYLFLLLAFIIPLERKLIPPIIILLFVSSLLNGSFKFKEKKGILALALLYVTYVVGLIYSTNLKYGLFDLEVKLSLLLFPLVFFISKIEMKKVADNILNSFIDGCFVASILSLVSAAIQYYLYSDINSFFYGELALYGHSSYMALFLCFSSALIYIKNIKQDNKISFPKKDLFLLALFSLIIFFLVSKTGIISILLIHFGFIGYLIIKNKLYLKGTVALVLISTLLFAGYKAFPEVNNRFNELFSTVFSESKELNSTSSIRTEIWKTSVKILVQHQFGVGTGDVKDVLVEHYMNSGLDYAAEKELNAHNQFLQIALATGVLGLLVLMVMIFYPLYYAIKNRHIIYIVFLGLIIINFLTEAMLETLAGVVFFAFFNTMLYTTFVQKIKNTK